MMIFPYLLFLLNQQEQVKKRGGSEKKTTPPKIEKQQTKATVFNVYRGKKNQKTKTNKKTPQEDGNILTSS